ncbi:MAG TPA: hypothetical protein VHT05_06165 [Candidatus Elarobacter sp.]|jgi:hypothetical protein|nr:hypothetical protein [Candidatus Elarobacter sp.]
MRLALAALALAVAAGGPVSAQTVTPPPDAPCTTRQTNLGGIGRGGVVSFVAAVSRAPVCATYANVAYDGFDAHLGDAPAPDALAAAAVTGGGDISLPLGGATLTGVGPYVVAPGGAFPDGIGDITEAPRVVLAFAGPRVLLISTTAVELVDLTRMLRDRPDLFGADAVERAVVIAGGPAAALELQGDSGPIGPPSIAAPAVLSLTKRR